MYAGFSIPNIERRVGGTSRKDRLNLFASGYAGQLDKRLKCARPIERLAADVLVYKTRLLTERGRQHDDCVCGGYSQNVSDYAIHLLIAVTYGVLVLRLIGV